MPPVVLLLRMFVQCVSHMFGPLLSVLMIKLELLVTVTRFALLMVVRVPTTVPLKNAALPLLGLLKLFSRLSVIK